MQTDLKVGTNYICIYQMTPLDSEGPKVAFVSIEIRSEVLKAQ